MKVLGLSCGRKMGNSEILVREALMATEELDAEVEVIRLGDLSIKPCVGCEDCVSNMLKGGKGECVQKNDHMPFLLNKMAECDGVILGVPAFMLMPPGLLLAIVNRTLGAGSGYKERIAENPKVGAVIAVGGTDWVNLVLPLTSFALSRLFRGNLKLVDQMLVTYIPRPSQVLLHEEAIARARKLGLRVGEALKMPYAKVRFYGEEPETCPLCHINLLKVRGKYVECPICDIKGNIEIQGNIMRVTFDDEELRKPRFGAWGIKIHDDAVLRGHQEYYERKLEIEDKLKRYKNHKPRTLPPSLKQQV